jgi:hypothetical protein
LVAIFAALMVIRPLWVSGIMMHLPLLKSMRWPFREILQLQFFLHLFLVMRPPGGSVSSSASSRRPAFSFFFFPSFFPARAHLSSHAPRPRTPFFRKIGPLLGRGQVALGPDDLIVPVADPEMIRKNPFDVPFSLLGAYNFPILFKVKSATGYSVTAPA